MPVMPEIRNTTCPIGGVTRPIIMLTTDVTPKCTGSMPSARTVGIRIGMTMKQHQQRIEQGARIRNRT